MGEVLKSYLKQHLYLNSNIEIHKFKPNILSQIGKDHLNSNIEIHKSRFSSNTGITIS